MKKPLCERILLSFSLGAGGLGLGLGIWLFADGTDRRGLLTRNHPAAVAILILTALFLFGLFLLTTRLKGTPAYKKLFPASAIAAAGCLVAAVGILITDFYELLTVKDPLAILSFIFGLLAAAALVFLGIDRNTGKRPHPLLHGCVTAYLMLHLICQYRVWSSEPQFLIYGFQMLASVFTMLWIYHRTTLDAGGGSRKWYVFFNCGALFFCCLALCSGNRLFYGTMVAYAATGLCSLEQISITKPMYLPREVRYCLNTLEQSGHRAYAVGGCVRDSLLGLEPQDYDICTSATPDQTAVVFARHRLVRNGEKHGTVGVVLNDQVYEITTFRTEGGYSDSRHPDWVNFVTSIEEDLARRDFTVNAMAYAPADGYVDPWDGQADLKNRVLRAVREPSDRFREDPLRILRGMRFAVRFGLEPDPATEEAMNQLAPLLDNLAKERVFPELCKLLPYVTAQDLLRYKKIITQVIPELVPAVDFQQHSPHHAYDVYTHTAHVVEAVPGELPLRLAALLHDIAKPVVFTMDENGRGHFYGHAKEGALMAEELLQRLHAPNALREQVVFLIEHHMIPFEPDKKLLRRRLTSYGEENARLLLQLQKADFSSKGIDDETPLFSVIDSLLEEIDREGACLSIKDLAITGRDILALGIEPGPHIGECMRFLLDLVHDEYLANTPDALINAAKKFFNREDTL